MFCWWVLLGYEVFRVPFSQVNCRSGSCFRIPVDARTARTATTHNTTTSNKPLRLFHNNSNKHSGINGIQPLAILLLVFDRTAPHRTAPPRSIDPNRLKFLDRRILISLRRRSSCCLSLSLSLLLGVPLRRSSYIKENGGRTPGAFTDRE
jgi:hypothetical protein